MTDTKPRVSGWCSAPAGVRPKHEGCRAAVCFCLCHEASEGAETAQLSGSEHFARYDWGTIKDGPRRCANTVIQGPRRSKEEID